MKVTRKNTTLELIILSLPSLVFLFIGLFWSDPSNSMKSFWIVLGFALSFITLFLANIYWNDELALTKKSITIKSIGSFKWEEILETNIFYTNHLISNYVRVEVLPKNSSKVVFFLCKKSFWEWELKSLEELEKLIPGEVKVNVIEKDKL